MYFVYIMECEDKSLYTGITTNVERRFKEHAQGTGGHFTRSHKVKSIVHIERRKNRSTASKREAEIKKLSKPQKLALIAGNK